MFPGASSTTAQAAEQDIDVSRQYERQIVGPQKRDSLQCPYNQFRAKIHYLSKYIACQQNSFLLDLLSLPLA